MAGIGINLDNPLGFLSSAFVDETAVAGAEGAAAANIAQINADATSSAAIQIASTQAQMITTIAEILGVILLIFLILWFLKS